RSRTPPRPTLRRLSPPTALPAPPPSGLSSNALPPGPRSRPPRPATKLKVHYTGWTTDGKMFDSSLARGVPATFNLQKVIPGWTEGLQLMTEGESRRFWIPERLAYKGQHGFPAGTLVFDVELIEVVKE